MKQTSACLLFLFASGCASHLAVMQQDKHDTTIALDEIRMELADVKHALNGTQVEVQILDEQIKNQDKLLHKTKGPSSPQQNDVKVQLLEKRLAQIEQHQEKIAADLRQLSSHANQTSSSLAQYKSKIAELEQASTNQSRLIEEISHVKTTLQSLASSAKQTKDDFIIYRVKPGDTLEKIAKANKITIDAIQAANRLTQSKIIIGQELKIPCE